MSYLTCKKCGRASETYECWRCERANKHIDVSSTIYNNYANKIEIDVDAEYNKIIELLTPAFSNANELKLSLTRLHNYISNKYKDFPSEYILGSIDLVINDAISKQKLQQKENDYKLKAALDVYNKQASAPVRGMGFSLITNDFVGAATYAAISSYTVNKQRSQKQFQAMKMFTDNLKSLNTNSILNIYDVLRAVNEAVIKLVKFAEVIHFIATHWDFYNNAERYDIGKTFLDADLYEIISKSVKPNSCVGASSDLRTNKKVSTEALESAGYIYRVGSRNEASYITTTKFEQEVLQELYYREFPEERKKAEESLMNQKICSYEQAKNELSAGHYYESALSFHKAIGYKDAKQCCLDIWSKHILDKTSISLGDGSACALKEDGTVAFVKNDADLSNWKNISHVECFGDGFIGLTDEGTICTIHENSDGTYIRYPTDWENIIQFDVYGSSAVGVHSNGTVSVVGNTSDGGVNISSWKNVKKAVVECGIVLGLKEDGTILLAGKKDLCEQDYQSWREIQDIVATSGLAIGLNKDGSVNALGDKGYVESISEWRNITRIKKAYDGVVGFTKDGKVLYAGKNTNQKCFLEVKENVVDVFCTRDFCLVLHSDGTVSSDSKCYDVSSWKNIVYITAYKLFSRELICGITKDGIVEIIGNNDYLFEIGLWKLFEDINILNRNDQELIKKNIEKKKTLISAEIADLQKELAELKGLFVGKKKKELVQKISDLERYLKY